MNRRQIFTGILAGACLPQGSNDAINHVLESVTSLKNKSKLMTTELKHLRNSLEQELQTVDCEIRLLRRHQKVLSAVVAAMLIL